MSGWPASIALGRGDAREKFLRARGGDQTGADILDPQQFADPSEGPHMESDGSFGPREHPHQVHRASIQGVELDWIRGRAYGHSHRPQHWTLRMRNCDSVADPGAEHGLAPLDGPMNFGDLVRHARSGGEDFAEFEQDITLHSRGERDEDLFGSEQIRDPVIRANGTGNDR